MIRLGVLSASTPDLEVVRFAERRQQSTKDKLSIVEGAGAHSERDMAYLCFSRFIVLGYVKIVPQQHSENLPDTD